jgi:hypothetical protein
MIPEVSRGDRILPKFFMKCTFVSLQKKIPSHLHAKRNMSTTNIPIYVK